MGIFDIFKRKNVTREKFDIDEFHREKGIYVDTTVHDSIDIVDNDYVNEPVSNEFDKYEELFDSNEFCFFISEGLGISLYMGNVEAKKQIPHEFLERCLDPKYFDAIVKNAYIMRKEIIQKIINNTLSLDDLNSNELNLIEFLPSSERIDTLQNRDSSKFDITARYVVLEANDNLTVNTKENSLFINSYFENISILTEKQKSAELVSILSSIDIKIVTKSNGKFSDNGYVVPDENVLSDDSIIVITFEKYKELSKNPELLHILNSHQLCISDDYDELSQLCQINLDRSSLLSGDGIDYKEAEKIKMNHISKVILSSNLSEIEKKYLLYNLNPFTVEKICQKLSSVMSVDDLKMITSDFNKLDYEEKVTATKKIGFDLELFYYKYPEFFNFSIEKQINILRNLTSDEFKTVIADSKISSLFDAKINEQVDLFKYQQLLDRINGIEENQCVREFVEKNGLSVKDILNRPEFDLKSEVAINKVLSNNHISAGKEEMTLTMEDIVGISKWHMRGASDNIIDNFKNFFQTGGDGYHTRGIPMLKFNDGNEAMEKLRSSFLKEPLKLDEYDGKFIVSGNGLHRTMVLKFFYMKDLAEGVLSREELRNKYTIPGCIVDKVDIEKTYAAYLLQLLDSTVKCVYKSDKENCDLVIYSRDKEAMNLPISAVKENIKIHLADAGFYELNQIERNYESYPSFKKYIDTNYSEYLSSILESGEIAHGKNI